MDYSKYTVETLNKMLLTAVTNEEFELAAEIRDVINSRGGVDSFMDLETQIKIILEGVDFDKIHSVMDFLDWKIFGNVPSVNGLKASAKKLLTDAWNIEEGHEICSMETGGMRVDRFIYDGMKMLRFKFILTGWEIDYDTVTLTYDEYMND
jgi:hypothetical protein